MSPELNWAGLPIREGEGYGGRPENIPETWSRKPAVKLGTFPNLEKQHQHFAVITENDLAEVFGNGSRKLKRREAAKLVEARTGAHRTSAYRALRLNGRFARHLHSDGAMLFWR
jgi:hypothetical protein